MHLSYFIVLLLAIISTSASAADTRTSSFSCSAAKNYFSAFKQPLGGALFHVSGLIQMNEPMGGKKFNPVANVGVRSTNDNDAVHLRVVQNKGERDLTLVVTRYVAGNETYAILAKVKPDAEVLFAIEGNALGHLKVTANNNATEVDLGASPATLELSCSSGDFNIKDVLLNDGDDG